MVVDLEGNSAASAAGMNVAAARDVLTAIMVAPAQWQVEGRVCMAQVLKVYMYIATPYGNCQLETSPWHHLRLTEVQQSS